MLAGMLPVLLLLVALCFDAGSVTYAWVRADEAVRAGAVAASRGAPEALVTAAVQSSLSQGLARDAQIVVKAREVRVTVQSPAALVLRGAAREITAVAVIAPTTDRRGAGATP